MEDPFSLKRSLTRSVSGRATLDYITDCFKIAYLYFGTIQTTVGPVVTKILVPDASPERKSPSSRRDKNKDSRLKGVEDILKQLKVGGGQDNSEADREGGAAAAAMVGKPPSDKVITLEELEKSFNKEEGEDSSSDTGDEEEEEFESSNETLESFLGKYGRELTPVQARRVTELVPKNKILFTFDADILTAGQSPVLSCSVCGADGHLQHACPEEEMPPVRPLPPPQVLLRRVPELDRVCLQVQRRFEPSANELRERDQFMRNLTSYIQRSYPRAVLTVFGSSQNGFAFAHSDLDVSLTFSDQETDEGIDAIDVIERLAEKLKRMQGVRGVQAITSAKVPIIKFTSVQYQPRIEGDISLYNILAQENTKMLRCYSYIDARVKVRSSIHSSYSAPQKRPQVCAFYVLQG